MHPQAEVLVGMLRSLTDPTSGAALRLDHDSELAILGGAALINSLDGRDSSDHMATAEELSEFLDEQTISGTRTGSEAELRAVRSLRTRLRSVFTAASEGDLPAAVDELNDIIHAAGATPRLVEHDGNPLHLHYTLPEAPLHHRLGAEVAIALAIVIRDGGLDLLRTCDAPDCDNVLVDLTKNHSRRYCDALCANRQHVAAYRRRRAEAD